MENSSLGCDFTTVMRIYNDSGAIILKNKKSLILFIIAQTINILNLIYNFFVLIFKVEVLSFFFCNTGLSISAGLMLLAIFFNERNKKKYLYKNTGVKLNKVSTYEIFLLKIDEKCIKKETLLNAGKYTLLNLEILNPKMKFIAPISFISGIFLPLIIGFFISYITNMSYCPIFDYSRIFNILLWILAVSLLYWIIEKISNYKFYKLEIFLRHIKFVLLEHHEIEVTEL